MGYKRMSKVCSCGKGHRSEWDLQCGHCRTKTGAQRLGLFKRELEKQERALQMQFYGFYTPDAQPGDGTINVEYP
ncbi:hypothetical protein [Pantoea phage LIMElight]|uniref:Uncharacterized protein n=1 Tax=Pantoea phage LIMElight TaxID=881915 RepID=E1Y3W8_9CAUD|nr:hypothetical protein F370_gp19 [Pantoea phage LIMElight]CBW54777.1 hypothetical protein [Pantoea phage LIMElight]